MSTQLTHRRYALTTIAMVVMAAIMAITLAACVDGDETSQTTKPHVLAGEKPHPIPKDPNISYMDHYYIPKNVDDPSAKTSLYGYHITQGGDTALYEAEFTTLCITETKQAVVPVAIRSYQDGRAVLSVRYGADTATIEGPLESPPLVGYSESALPELMVVPTDDLFSVQLTLYTEYIDGPQVGPEVEIGPIEC